jgi:AcrR family transcriptional regulator
VNPTKAKLLTATAHVLREDGFAALSARTVATRAGVNQALVFYHFGTVAELVDAATRQAADESAERYREAFAGVTSVGALLALGRELHERERAAGNVAMMAQLMAGAQGSPELAAAARYAMDRWTREIESVLHRVLADNPLAGVLEPAGLARAVSAGFIGLELYEGVDRAGAEQALATLERLAVAVDVVGDLGPVARRALRSRVRSLGAG